MGETDNLRQVNVGEDKIHLQEPSVQKEKTLSRLRMKQTILFAIVELLLILCYVWCAKYGAGVDAKSVVPSNLSSYYPMYQDVNVLVFVGFGFLLTFVRFNSWSGVGFSFMLGAFAIQWGILCYGFAVCCMFGTFSAVSLDITAMLQGQFCAMAVLISYGAFAGKVNGLQLLVICLFECFFFAMNKALNLYKIKAIDVGQSMYVHAFGAFFGLGVSFMLGMGVKAHKCKKNNSNYTSNVFAFIGTLFLWCFWPSFVACLSTGSAQHRAVLNTILSMACSCLGAFMQSQIQNGGLFKMQDALNATLAGGIATGSCAEMICSPWIPMLIGFIAGQTTSLKIHAISSALNKKVHDTRNVGAVHGFNGILSGIITAIIVASANKTSYGVSWVPVMGELGAGRRGPWSQFGWQLLALFNSVAIGAVSGALTGFVVKLGVFEPAKSQHCFDDEFVWSMEQSEEALDKVTANIVRHETVNEVIHREVEEVQVESHAPQQEYHYVESPVRYETTNGHHHHHHHHTTGNTYVNRNHQVQQGNTSHGSQRQGRYSNSAQNRNY